MEDERNDSDWGLAPEKPGFSRENKFILFVLVVLVAVFSFVVFRNFQKKQLGTTPTDVAAKTEKDNTGKDKKSAAKPASTSDGAPSQLLEPAGDEEPATAKLSSTDNLSNDPFDGAGTSTAGTQSEQAAAAPAQSVDEFAVSQELPSETDAPRQREVATNDTANEMAESGAPPQLQTTEEAPGQSTDLFEPPIEQQPEVATNSRGSRRGRGGRSNHSQPAAAEPREELPTSEESPMQTADFNEGTTEATGSTGFEVGSAPEEIDQGELAQTGGTAGAEPIQKRGGSPVTPAATPNLSGVPNDAFDAEQVAQTAPRTTTPRTTTPRTTTPRTTTPRTTAPRTALGTTPGTNPRTAGQQPTGFAPPPLDPSDERLGGFREADLVPAISTPRTAGRAPVAMPVGQFDPHTEPLVANVGEYVIKPNDNYWRISRKVYGTARYFQALEKHNAQIVRDTKHMKPGTRISTPPKEHLEQQYGELVPAAPSSNRPLGAVINPPNAPKTAGYFMEPNGQPAYRVGSRDTLSSISQKTLGRSSRYDEIYEMNKDRLGSADDLSPGLILRLPVDASQTRMVGKPIEHR